MRGKVRGILYKYCELKNEKFEINLINSRIKINIQNYTNLKNMNDFIMQHMINKLDACCKDIKEKLPD